MEKYEICHFIKKGAFGSIYKGQCKRTQEYVAIKTELAASNENPVFYTLKHEAKILQHLHISGLRAVPPVYWYGTFDSINHLIMPFYTCSLADYFEKKGRVFKGPKICGIAIQLIGLLEAVHSKYVLHRDIKPQNIMIKDGGLVLIDFGLATFYMDSEGKHFINDGTETMIGTPKFTSINIHKGCRYSRRDDLISIGYLLFYLLIGETIWEPSLDIDVDSDISEIYILHPFNQMRMQNKEIDAFFLMILSVYGLQVDGLRVDGLRVDELGFYNSFALYLRNCYELGFSVKPDYFSLKQLFIELTPDT